MKKLVALLILAVAFVTVPAFTPAPAFAQSAFDAFDKGAQDNFNTRNLGRRERERRERHEAEMLEAQSVRRARDAANRPKPHPHYTLGRSYFKGDGVPQDYKEAMKWFMSAAEQGDANAHSTLGFMYGTGEGVLQDYVRAHMWMNLAASNGHQEARENRDIVVRDMTPAQIDKAQNLARECLAKSYKGC